MKILLIDKSRKTGLTFAEQYMLFNTIDAAKQVCADRGYFDDNSPFNADNITEPAEGTISHRASGDLDFSFMGIADAADAAPE